MENANSSIQIAEYVDQSLSDLSIIQGDKEFVAGEKSKTFFVQDNESDIFTIRECSGFSYGDFNITIFILGESHAVMVRRESDIVLFEICACTKVSKKLNPILLKEMHDGEVLGKYINGHTYAFKKRYLNKTNLEEIYDYFGVLLKQDNVKLLEHNFCGDGNCDHDVEPMTKVVVKVDNDNKNSKTYIYIYSTHVYPDGSDQSKIAAFTESVIIVNG